MQDPMQNLDAVENYTNDNFRGKRANKNILNSFNTIGNCQQDLIDFGLKTSVIMDVN